MDKKDIYEHLANIYLDASSTKKKRKKKSHSRIFRNILFGIIPVLVFSLIKFSGANKVNLFSSETSLILLPSVAKINFNFDPAKKETYTFNLNKLSLKRFKELGFSLKKKNYKDNISLRVEFTNSFREKSEVYFKDIPHKWHNYKIALAEFKNISNWSEILNLTFAVEEWNAKQKSDVVYIDNVRLIQ